MKKKNYLSAFDAILHVYSCVGQEREEISWPDFDWVARFRTTSEEQVYIASNINGVLTNCFNDNGRIHVIFVETHGLEPGELSVVFDAKIPNGMYPGGKQREVTPQPMDIELVRGRGDCGTLVDIDILVPYIQFKYADLTPEEKAELSKPATDAAASVAVLEEQVSAAEQQRILNEATRLEFEAGRLRNEATREANEQSRKEAEDTRRDFETARQAAEHTRTQQFTKWESTIDNKADRAELSNVLAEEPLTSDNFPDINTYTREQLKKDLFVDMWNQAAGKYGCYNVETGFFELFNVKDLSLNEALDIMQRYRYIYTNPIQLPRSNSKQRALLPIVGLLNNAISIQEIFRDLVVKELLFKSDINQRPFDITNAYRAFSGCRKLEVIHGGLYFIKGNYSNTQMFRDCFSLREVRLQNLTKDISFEYCPNISIDTFKYLIAYAGNTSQITITVHTEVYAKITDENNADWHQILIDAADKNITFATV